MPFGIGQHHIRYVTRQPRCVKLRYVTRRRAAARRSNWCSTGSPLKRTVDQNPELQLEALTKAGCGKIFTERASGAREERPELRRVLEDVLRSGDTLVVWKLDRLARSLKKLISTAEDLDKRGVGLV